ncbi:MAG: DNA repair protein RecO [Pseudohongiella sp.]|nr:DNA repair protein RecO [Pseudohongiella sp.]
MSRNIELQPAYVLHTREYRDTSLLVDFLTLDYGLLRVVARGVRGKKSNRRALLQALQPLLVSTSGRGELQTLTAVEAAAPVFQLHGERLFSVLYINEILTRLLQPGQAHPEIYRLYQSSLVALLNNTLIECALRRFEYQLLFELGYGPDLSYDAGNGAPIQLEETYLFDPQTGLSRCDEVRENQKPDRFTGQQIIEMKCLLISDATNTFDKQLLSTAKRFMRQALRPLLGVKPLNSRQLFISPGSAPVFSLPPDKDNR